MEEKEKEAGILLQHERNMLLVIIFTIIAMIGEIAFGYITKSMSLLAEGFHMSVHVLTLGLTYVAYILARKLKNSTMFINGTSKIGVLAGYTSSLFLFVTGIGIMLESAMRFIHPEEIQFTEAIYASIFALIINYICIAVMENKFHLHHSEENESEDYNYKAAYYHILSDVLMSVLTIIALVVGKHYNCIHLDALAGIFGAVLIIVWAGKLLKNTVKILIDMK
ncbi:MAG: cation diffusion facilitator family transporter [Candidatus Gastranaerophilales bacterium]|nr:cation diffusion facilitator family transporter [Candidatus Gastranaerophilales bacterium]